MHNIVIDEKITPYKQYPSQPIKQTIVGLNLWLALHMYNIISGKTMNKKTSYQVMPVFIQIPVFTISEISCWMLHGHQIWTLGLGLAFFWQAPNNHHLLSDSGSRLPRAVPELYKLEIVIVRMTHKVLNYFSKNCLCLYYLQLCTKASTKIDHLVRDESVVMTENDIGYIIYQIHQRVLKSRGETW